jgi:hypothetical protein
MKEGYGSRCAKTFGEISTGKEIRVGDDPCNLSINATLTLRLSTMTPELHLRHFYAKTLRSTASGVDEQGFDTGTYQMLKPHTRGWNTIQAIRGHRRRREVEWEMEGGAVSDEH